jgi:adenosylcobinamide-phosphate synthase
VSLAWAIPFAAMTIDRAFGEPRNALHPVAWIGSLVSRLVRLAPASPNAALVFGIGLATILPTGVAWVVAETLSALPPLPRWIAELWIVTTCTSLRSLEDAALVVGTALDRDDLPGARAALSSLCSRDASSLAASDVAGAAVSSVAENASDSWVAPLFFYAIAGAPGAAFYRVVNTLDSMVGYRVRYPRLGWASARLDDLLNLVPARLTGALFVIVGALRGRDARAGFRTMVRDASRTPSPNGGYPMSATAGLLGVRLEKPGVYVLNESGHPCGPSDIRASISLLRDAGHLAVAIVTVVLLVQGLA